MEPRSTTEGEAVTHSTPVRCGLELGFTDIHRCHSGSHPAVREAACLRFLLPRLLLPIRENDLLAGRIRPHPPVGFGSGPATGGTGYYCLEHEIRQRMASEPFAPGESIQVERMIDYWRGEATFADGRLRSRLSRETLDATAGPVAGKTGRLTGGMVDFDKLVRVGIPGLINEIENGLEWSLRGHGDPGLYEGMTTALCLLIDTCLHYGNEARDLSLLHPRGSSRRMELLKMADDLDHLIISRPERLSQAIQLFWLYSLLSGVTDLGRMDVVLGDLYIREIDSGRLSKDGARQLLQSFWRLIAGRDPAGQSRIVLGGRGRRNEVNADRFAVAAMEVAAMEVAAAPGRWTPRIDLRIYRGMSPALMQLASDPGGPGGLGPSLHDDDEVIPAVAGAFDVSEEEAGAYLPSDPGGYVLDHASFGLLNGSIDLRRVLELTLHDGRDPSTGERVGLPLGGLRDFGDFEEVLTAYDRQIAHFAGHLARRQAVEYEIAGAETAFLFLSMLQDGCLESGRSVVGRGPNLTGGRVEAHGLSEAVHTLTTIRRMVFERKVVTPGGMLVALATDPLHAVSAVHPGQTVARVGEWDDSGGLMARRVLDLAGQAIKRQAAESDLDFFLIVAGEESSDSLIPA